MVIHQLKHILVAGDHVDRIGLLRRFAGERPNQIVSLVTGPLEDWDVVSLEGAADVWQLLR